MTKSKVNKYSALTKNEVPFLGVVIPLRTLALLNNGFYVCSKVLRVALVAVLEACKTIGGGGGIRTHGPLRATGFLDRRTKPSYATPPCGASGWN